MTSRDSPLSKNSSARIFGSAVKISNSCLRSESVTSLVTANVMSPAAAASVVGSQPSLVRLTARAAAAGVDAALSPPSSSLPHAVANANRATIAALEAHFIRLFTQTDLTQIRHASTSSVLRIPNIPAGAEPTSR